MRGRDVDNRASASSSYRGEFRAARWWWLGASTTDFGLLYEYSTETSDRDDAGDRWFRVGALTGLVGVGGGFAIIPALVLLGNVPMTEAISTSLLIISFNSIAGLMGYLEHVEIDWQLTVSFTFAATIGTLFGAYLARFVSAQQLQKGFGYFLLAVAGFILFENRHSFVRSLPDRSNLPINTNTPHNKVAYLDRSKVLDN